MLFQPFSKGRISFSHKPSSKKGRGNKKRKKSGKGGGRGTISSSSCFLQACTLFTFCTEKQNQKIIIKNILVDNIWRNIFIFTKIHLFFGWFPRFALAVEVVMCRQKIPGYLETKWRKRKGKRRRQRPFDRNFLTFFSGRGIACPFAVCQKNRPPLFWFIIVSGERI